VTIGPLDIGFHSKPVLRRETLATLPPGSGSLKLLYLSDLHYWGAHSLRSARETLEACSTLGPDLVALGGDLVDGQKGLAGLSTLVEGLSHLAPVWAVGGNHDFHYGLRQVRDAVVRGEGNWLGSRSVELELQGIPIRLDGKNRPQADDGRFRIYCAHAPDSFPKAAVQGYDLMLAGHLHGCQFVFWEDKGELYPGRIFFRWNGLRYARGRTHMIVGRGAGDMLPFRWNCPREILLIDLAAAAGS
jgi:predicted MPP superfamily phosphohydrolase